MRNVNLYAVFASAVTLILAQPPPWEYLGCYTDGDSPRALFHLLWYGKRQRGPTAVEQTIQTSTSNPDPLPVEASPTAIEQTIPTPTSTANGSFEQTAWYFDGCFAPNLNTQYIVGIGVETTMPLCLSFCNNKTNVANDPAMPMIYAGIYDEICFCATSMEAFSLTHGIGSGDTSCAAQCAEDNDIACSGAAALGITTIVPLLPLFPGTGCP